MQIYHISSYRQQVNCTNSCESEVESLLLHVVLHVTQKARTTVTQRMNNRCDKTKESAGIKKFYLVAFDFSEENPNSGVNLHVL